jgi:hypothetical protein
MFRYYATNVCNTNEVINTVGRLNGLCAVTGADSSMEWDWPNMDTFLESDSCQGTPTSVKPFSTSCLRYNTTTDIDDLTFTSYSLVNPALSQVPSVVPTTFSPTLSLEPSAVPTTFSPTLSLEPSAVPSSVSPAPTGAPYTGSNSNSNDSFSSMGGIGGLSGIIVGGVVVVGLVVGVVVYYFFYKKATNNLKSPLMSFPENSNA